MKFVVPVVAAGVLAGAGWALWPAEQAAPVASSAWVAPVGSTAPESPGPSPSVSLTIKPAPRGLPVIDYTHVPSGFPDDTGTNSTDALTEGLRPATKLAVYDAPGGEPLAYLPSSISGVEITVPVVEKRDGWIAVLLPSVNRRVGWVPEKAKYDTETLTDQLVVTLSDHSLTWLKDGVKKASWTVATGASRTPTPLGRTFVMGRTTTEGAVYAGEDALVLGAVPDDKDNLAEALKNGHTAIHAWYRPSAFGHSVSNGCVRIPKAAQQTLLDAIPAGTPVVVVA